MLRSRATFLASLSFALLFAAAGVTAQTLTIIGGDHQTIPRRGSEVSGGIARFEALGVVLRDPSGQGIPNASITFHCSVPRSMACQFTPGGDENGTLHINTDGNGVAWLNRIGGKSMHVYYSDGPVPLRASWQNLFVDFQLRVDPASGSQYSSFAKVVSGNDQRAMRVGEEPFGGTAHFGPITIQVLDPNGNPVANKRVMYGCGGSSCNFGQSSMNTDGNGMFTVESVSEYYAAGWFSVHFVAEDMKELEVHLLATDPPKQVVTWVPGAKLTVVRGDNQTGAREGNQVQGGIARFGPMAVRLTAPDGSPIANVPIQFDCHKAWNFSCQLTASGAENGSMSVNTDADGVATLSHIGGDSLHFYYNTGAHTMTASYGNIASVTLHFTVTR